MRIVNERGELFRDSSGRAVIRWNSGARSIDKSFSKLQVFIDNTVVRHMDAYVPMRTGILKKSVVLGSRMGSGELVYIAPYAKKRYYTEGRLKRKRGHRWFHKMWAARGNDIIREVKDYSRRLMP